MVPAPNLLGEPGLPPEMVSDAEVPERSPGVPQAEQTPPTPSEAPPKLHRSARKHQCPAYLDD